MNKLFPMDPYRHLAPAYDALTAVFLRGPRNAVIRACLDLSARRILDVGCGTGLLAYMLQIQDGVEFVAGLDTSLAMLERCRAAGAKRRMGEPAPFFVRACADRFPFAPGSFDLLIYALMLHETASSPEALLRQGFFLAAKSLVLEWRLPERNLDFCRAFWVPFIERLAGREHYRHYRAFMRQGGTRGLAERVGAEVIWERPLRGNSLMLSLLQKSL